MSIHGGAKRTPSVGFAPSNMPLACCSSKREAKSPPPGGGWRVAPGGERVSATTNASETSARLLPSASRQATCHWHVAPQRGRLRAPLREGGARKGGGENAGKDATTNASETSQEPLRPFGARPGSPLDSRAKRPLSGEARGFNEATKKPRKRGAERRFHLSS